MQKIENRHGILLSVGPYDIEDDDQKQCILEIEYLLQIITEPEVKDNFHDEQDHHNLISNRIEIT